MNNIEVIENGIIDLEERKLQINENNIKVLESVKEILTLGQSELMTVQMAADYFEINKNALEVCIKRNRKEFESNGLKLYKRNEVLNLHSDSLEKVPNRGLILLTKRTLLNIGMILTESKAAKELRRRILDIVHDAEDNKGSIENIVNEIDEETKLSMDLGVAMVKGDINEVMNLNTKIFELKKQKNKTIRKCN